MTLLTIIAGPHGTSGAAARCGIVPPTACIGNPDKNIAKMVAYAEDAGRDCIERVDWRSLKFTTTITGDGSTTLWSLPTDFMRLCPSDKSPKGAFVSNVRPLLPLFGPVNDEELNQAKQFPAMPVVPLWRLIGSYVEIWPALAAAEIVTYNYFSNAWINPVLGANQTAWGLDTDTSIINEDTIMKGVVWRWKCSEGLDYAEDMRQFELSLDRNAAQEGTGRIVSMSLGPRSGGELPFVISYP